MPKLRVHIGHHFFGSGNVGDDLMLAGFLEAARPEWLAKATLTCCTPHDRECQQRRFPEIEWLPYDRTTRAACIERADVWLGLGDTPFQAAGGHTWFLDHLEEEAAWCRQYGTPMYYLGVGVGERAAANYPQVRALVDQAERVWTRDENSAEMLRPLATPGKVTAHADLAHLALSAVRFPSPEADTLGLVLNFEDPTQFSLERLAALVRAAGDWRLRWLAQEVRPLPGSETWLHGRLPPELHARAPLRLPDYAQAVSARSLLSGWEGLESIFSSRYHAALLGAWMGAGVAAFARNDKVAGAIRQLGLASVANLDDPAAILRCVQEARPVERRVLVNLAGEVREVCEDFFTTVMPRARRPATASVNAHAPGIVDPPRRLLFVRADADGDLCLFMPVLRIVRDAWPQTEVAVLTREPDQDISLLLGDGVRWLTTVCDPYREAPVDCSSALDTLCDTVRGFAPDCVVAACAEQTWLEAAVAAFSPDARHISLGWGLTDPVKRGGLSAVLPVDWAAIYPHKIPVEPNLSAWEQNLHLAVALLGKEAPRRWPAAQVPASVKAQAARIIAEIGPTADEFIFWAAAGTANVRTNGWPAESYGETLAWLANDRSMRASAEAAASRPPFLRDDSADRLREIIELTLQSGELGRRLQTIDADRTARLRQIEELTALLKTSEADRSARHSQVRELTSLLEASEADRVARLSQVGELTALLKTSEADRDARQNQVRELATLLEVAEADRGVRLKQVEELTALLATSEADRAARLEQIKILTALLLDEYNASVPRVASVAELVPDPHAGQIDPGVSDGHT